MNSDEVFGANLAGLGPAAFGRLIERLLWHLGFSEVTNIDGSGDEGADLVALRDSQRWVFQAKSKQTSPVDSQAVNEARNGMQAFEANRGAVVTNGRFTNKAADRAKQLRQATGVQIGLWQRSDLVELFLTLRARNVFPNLMSESIKSRPSRRHGMTSKKLDLRFLYSRQGLERRWSLVL